MSRTPGHAHPAAAAASAAKPAAPNSAPATDAKPGAAAATSRRNLAIGGGALAAVALLAALFVWKPWAPEPPRLNEPPAEIAKFSAAHLGGLPFSHQRQFMELLDEKDDAVLEAYEQGKLNDAEYRRVLQLAWYGEHLKKMDNYHSKPPSQRTAYLDKQADKKRKKKSDPKKNVESDSKSALKAEEIERDDSTEEQDVKQWPSDVRQKWAEYRTAWSNRKQFLKEQRDQQKAAEPAGAEAAATPGGAQ
jgi:hypothetical protein